MPLHRAIIVRSLVAYALLTIVPGDPGAPDRAAASTLEQIRLAVPIKRIAE